MWVGRRHTASCKRNASASLSCHAKGCSGRELPHTGRPRAAKEPSLHTWRHSAFNCQVSVPYDVDAWIRCRDWRDRSHDNHLRRWACPRNGNLVRLALGLARRLSTRDHCGDYLRLAACVFVLEVASHALVAVRNDWLYLCHPSLDRACRAVHICPLGAIGFL